MNTYFGFSDECGTYKKEKCKKHLKAHPFYIRSTLLINAKDWKQLNNNFRDLKRDSGLPNEIEIKWAYLWQLRNFQKNGQRVPSKKEFKFLESFDYHELIDFVEKSLSLIHDINFKKIIITHTDNKNCPRIAEKELLKMHLQEHMQRVEMQIQSRIQENLAVLFFDPVSEQTDKNLRDIYFDLFNSGDFIVSYKHIKDSLNIEHSHQSVGIQLADYISGTYSAILKGQGNSNYDRGKKMFYDHVYPYLRKYNGTIWGAGIREVPSDEIYRRKLAEEMNNELNN